MTVHDQRRHRGAVGLASRSLGAWVLLLLAAGVIPCLTGCSKQSRLEHALARGDQFHAAGRFEEARIEYQNALQIDPRNARAAARVGELYFDAGMPRQAAPFLLRARQMDPANAGVRTRLGQLFLAAGKLKEARDVVTEVLAKDASHAEAVLLLGDLAVNPEELRRTEAQVAQLRQTVRDSAALRLVAANLKLRQNDRAGAEADTRQALVLDPGFAAAYQMLAGFSMGRSNLVEAEQHLRKAAQLSPVRSARWIQLTEFLTRQGRPADARTLLEELTGKAPDFLPGWVTLAQLDFDQGRLEESLAKAERVLARDALHLQAGVLRGRILIARQQAGAACEQLEILAREYPRSPELRYQLALAQLANSRADDARASLELTVGLQPGAPNAVLLLAELNLRRGALDDAVNALSDLARRRPQDARVRVALAKAYAARGRFDEALRLYAVQLESSPQDTDALLSMGLVYRAANRPADARRTFDQCLRLSATNLVAHGQLVDLDLQAKDTNAAVARAEAVVQSMPASAPARYLLGRVLVVAGRPSPAEEQLKKAIELDPEARPAYLQLAQLYVAGGRQDAALREIEVFLSKNPSDASGLVLAGTLYTQKGQLAKAQAAYEQLLKASPKQVAALNNLAYLSAELLRQPDKGLEYARRARALRPNDPVIADTYAWILYLKGQYREALPIMTEASERLPAEPEVQYHLGMIQYMVGNEDAARVALRRALGSSSRFNGREEGERRLATLDVDVRAADPKTVAALEKVLADSPGDSGTALRLGAIFERGKNYSGARTVYEKALKANAGNVPLLTALGALLAGPMNDPVKALEPLKTARSLASSDAQVGWLLGRTAFATGDQRWAANLLEEAARKLPGQGAPNIDLAWSRFALGRIAEARQAMDTALQCTPPIADPASARRFVALCDLYLNPGRAAAAAREIEDTLKADSNHGPALLAAAAVYRQQSNAGGARQALERLLAKYPLCSAAQREAALAWMLAPADYAKAYEYATKAREAFPEDLDTARVQGIAAFQRKNYSRAALSLEAVARARTNDAEVYCALGASRLQLKESAAAREALQKAIALDPSGPWGREATKVLQGMPK